MQEYNFVDSAPQSYCDSGVDGYLMREYLEVRLWVLDCCDNKLMDPQLDLGVVVVDGKAVL